MPGPRSIHICPTANLVNLVSMIVVSSVASCTFSRQDAAGATCRLNTAGDHDLQSLQQMVAARALAASVRADCSFWRCSSRTQPRQFACEGTPLGGRRKRGEWAQAVGRSRGGRTSKIHCLADDRGRPVAFALTPGNVADISMAVPLLGAVASPNRLIADKAYDADSLRNWLKLRRIHRNADCSLSARSHRLSTSQPHRAPLLPPRKLAALGNTIRPFGQKLSRRTRSHRGRCGVDLNESST